MTLLIKNGHVIDLDTQTDEVMDLFIEDDTIVKRDKKIEEKADKIIDASGLYVMPGFIDMHVHLRDPGQEAKETVVTGSKAAARGGFTTILAMPNTRPVVDNPDVVQYVHQKAKNLGAIHVLQVGAITKGQKGEELADIEGMVAAGSPAISEDGKSVMNTKLLRDAMKIAAKLKIPVLSHCEDINLVEGGVVNADEHGKKMGFRGITNSVEDVIIARDIMVANDTKAALHLCHCSTKDSVKMVALAKQEGIHVTAEVCPHHFILTSDDIVSDDANYKMNPPLRTKADVEALKEGLKSGIMDVISTDHAPHTEEEKGAGIRRAPFGIVGLETVAALTYTELVLKKYLTPMQMAEKMSYNPSKILGLDKGSLAVGKKADIVLFDPNVTYKIDKTKFWSKGKNTPFDGRTVTGMVKTTIVDGRVAYDSKMDRQ